MIMSPPPYLQPGESVVLYDGVCKLCNGWVNFLLRHRVARQVRFASVQSEEGKTLLKWAGLPQENVSTIVYIADQQHWLRAQAVFRVMQKMAGPWRFLSVLRHFPDSISNFAYDRIALNRYKLFGRYDSQHSLTPDYPGRFLHQKEKSAE
jgi:predicted DCC family thiol-disulfide oxidoreductase YuxK